MKRISLVGRVALVTGAGGGLGRAHALALAERGAAVVVNDIAGAQEVADEIVAAGGAAVGVPGSVANRAEARAAVECALDSFGTIDVVVNNAGIGGSAPFHEESLDHFEEMVAVHLLGTAAVTHAAWPVMRDKRYGRVVITTSTAGIWGVEDLQPMARQRLGRSASRNRLRMRDKASGSRSTPSLREPEPRCPPRCSRTEAGGGGVRKMCRRSSSILPARHAVTTARYSRQWPGISRAWRQFRVRAQSWIRAIG
ncbi:MAG: SDR family NAD(P)-dependent oxidoreductase [Sphingopyxis sp.]|nr:SDR family NAD(P)-dependent oxidoreductase [Sphingopyxis sp.]